MYVRIRLTTHNGGQITGEPMPRTQAINTLKELYDLDTTKWDNDVQTYHAGNGNMWTFRLLSA